MVFRLSFFSKITSTSQQRFGSPLTPILSIVVASPLAGAFGGLLASGILKLSNIGYLKEWQLIFVIEGIITVGVGALSFFFLTDRPAVARWLTDEEKELAEQRIVSENLTSTVLDKITSKGVMAGIFSIK